MAKFKSYFHIFNGQQLAQSNEFTSRDCRNSEKTKNEKRKNSIVFFRSSLVVQKQFKFGFMKLAGHGHRQNKFAYTFSMFSMEQVVYWAKKQERETGRKKKQSAVKLWPQRLSEYVRLFTLVILVAYVYVYLYSYWYWYTYFGVAKVHIFSRASSTIRLGPYLVTVQCTRDSSPMYDKQT